MVPYFLLMLDASHLLDSEVSEPLGLIWCPHMYDLEVLGNKCTKAFTNEIEKLGGKSPSFLGIDCPGNQYLTHSPGRHFKKPHNRLYLLPKRWPSWLLWNNSSPQSPFPSLLLPKISLPEKIIAHKHLSQAPGSGVPRYSRYYECSANYSFSC